MGILSRLSRRANSEPDVVVTVAFRDLAANDPLANFSPDHGYAYVWPFPEPPRIGDWAIAPGWDGPASVVVGRVGIPASAAGETLKTLVKRIPPEHVEQARAEKDQVKQRWLAYARHVADIPTEGAPVTAPPSGFDPLPPARGTAPAETADEYGRAWSRAYNLALELNRPADEVAEFKKIRTGWFRLRDQAVRDERDHRMANTVAGVDLDAAIGSVRDRPRTEIETMLFAGQPLWDWLAHVQAVERDGNLAQALRLLEALITAAEQEAAISGREPAPAYTERAAIIHRKRKDYAAEIAVIERWDRACPPERRGPGATQARLLARLDRARDLAAKS